MSCLYILAINPLSVVSLTNIFSRSKSCLFILFMVSLVMQSLLSLIRSHLFIFGFSMDIQWNITVRSEIMSFADTWMNLETVKEREVKSERENQISYIDTYMWNLGGKWYR